MDKMVCLEQLQLCMTENSRFVKIMRGELNYGDDGADGTLEQNGANIAISAGHYIIDFDAVNFTITVTPAETVWGVVGSATLNGWGDAEDVKLMPDPCNDGVYISEKCCFELMEK